MDEIEIPLFDEINDYNCKFGMVTLRQLICCILGLIIIVPVYLFGRKYVGDDIMSFAIMPIAIVFGVIGFVNIHGLPAEKIIPYWYRHYTLFAKPIKYISDNEYEQMQLQKSKLKKASVTKGTDKSVLKTGMSKEEKELKKAMKKYGHKFINTKEDNENNADKNEATEKNSNKEITDRLNSLTEDERSALVKLLDKNQKEG